jgi:type I site-specific restriction endonuclease
MPGFFRMRKRMLVLAHRQELLEQAAERFAATAPDLSVGIEQGSRSAPSDARIVLASVPTVGRVSAEAPWVDVSRIENADDLPLVAERVDLFRFEPPPEIAEFTEFAW